MLHSWPLGHPACLRHLEVKRPGAPPSTGVLRDLTPVPVACLWGNPAWNRIRRSWKQRLQSKTARSCSALRLNPALPSAPRQHGTGEATDPARPACHGWAAQAQLQRLLSSLSRAGLTSSTALCLQVTAVQQTQETPLPTDRNQEGNGYSQNSSLQEESLKSGEDN